jgi:O-antigen/teichoic acid export membrane protein
VVILCSLGLDGAMRRLYFDYVDDPSLLARYISTVLRSAACITLLALATTFLAGPYLLATLAPGFHISFFPYIALALVTAGISQPFQYQLRLYQIQGHPKPYGLLSSAVIVVTSVIAIVLVVVVRWGAVGMLLAQLLGAGVVTTIALYSLRRWLLAGWEWRFLRETIHLGLPLILYQFTLVGLEVADRFILQRYRSVDEVGLYSLAYTFGMVMFLITFSIIQAWNPAFFDLARHGEAGRRTIGHISSGLFILLAAIALFGTVIARDFVALVFDSRYHAAGYVIPVIICAYLLHGLFGLFQLSVMQAKKANILTAITFIAFVVNIVLNLWLIPIGGMYGAAYATLAAFGVEAVLTYAYAQRVYSWPHSRLHLTLTTAMVGGMLVLTQLPWSTPTRPVALLVALLIAYGVLWLLGGRNLIQTAKLLWARQVAQESALV